jgi:hypothetical protein
MSLIVVSIALLLIGLEVVGAENESIVLLRLSTGVLIVKGEVVVDGGVELLGGMRSEVILGGSSAVVLFVEGSVLGAFS